MVQNNRKCVAEKNMKYSAEFFKNMVQKSVKYGAEKYKMGCRKI